MKQLIVMTFFSTLLMATVAIGAEPKTLMPLRFLIGEWIAQGGGTPGQGAGSTTFSMGLQDRVIFRTNFAEYPASAERAAFRHDDFMVIYVDADSSVKADYFDNEGHVIRYSVSASEAGRAVFTSPASSTSPRFRLTYEEKSDNVLHGEFAIAPPGKPESFKAYLTWDSRRR